MELRWWVWSWNLGEKVWKKNFKENIMILAILKYKPDFAILNKKKIVFFCLNLKWSQSKEEEKPTTTNEQEDIFAENSLKS